MPIILCLDGCDSSFKLSLSNLYPEITIIHNVKTEGKIKSQLKCLKLSTKHEVLILDADISLFSEKVTQFVAYFRANNIDFLCPYSIGSSSNMNSLLFRIAEIDRYMRQRIIRAGRDSYGVSNLSGYCFLAKRDKYVNIIDSEAIQDDVIATINLLKNGYNVKTYHTCVCSEIERMSFISYLFQKTRWTAGNIILLKSYHLLFKYIDKKTALAFTSSFLLWYWANWIDFIAILFSIVYPILIIPLLIEFLLKYFSLTAINKDKNKIVDTVLYLCFWPIFSTVCLILTPYYLSGKIREQKTRRNNEAAKK